MRLCQIVLRWFTPACERERMEYRALLSRANAHAEDLNRTMSANAEDIRRALERVRQERVSERR